jgi:hypothetical protein
VFSFERAYHCARARARACVRIFVRAAACTSRYITLPHAPERILETRETENIRVKRYTPRLRLDDKE